MTIYFNPRSREGSDIAQGFKIFATFVNFNPRSREGSDEKGLENCSDKYGISIHAPARGATKAASIRLRALLFQSTLPRGERQAARKFWNS